MDSITSIFKSSDEDIYAKAPCDLVSSRYNSAIEDMQVKVAESWENLQPSALGFMPSFLGGSSQSAKSAQENFISNYKQYYSASKELKRCGIPSKPLSDSVKTVAQNLGLF